MRFAVAGDGPAHPPASIDHQHRAEEAIEI
jgi:hypothetical protein